MRYTTLLMDADDTIFDFPKCERMALKLALESEGLRFDDEICSSFSRINSALWKQFEMHLITRGDLRISRFRQLIEKCFEGMGDSRLLADRYVECLSGQAIYIDGAEEALKELSGLFEIHIITNGLKKVQRNRLAISGLEKYVRKVFISDEMDVQKPDREFFEIALGELDERDRSRILVVGDSLTSDMQGGRNAGLDTCIYDPRDRITMPHPLCDYKIHRLSELEAFAREEGL